MPQIIVTAGHAAHDDEAVTWRERVNASDFESERFTTNLVERLGWAVLDAVEAERMARPRRERGDDGQRTEARPITGGHRRQRETEPERDRGSSRDGESERELEPVGSA